MNQPDINKRLKGFRIPIEICVKYERMAGVKAGHRPTKSEADKVSEMMVGALVLGCANYTLTPRDYIEIAREIENNAKKRK